jgi:peptide/nickel transport system permease protein
MTGFLLRRLGQAIIVILGVTAVVFLLGQLIPGGQARAALGPKATPMQLSHFNIVNGFNESIWVQYWHYILRLLHGNLGYSYRNNQGVTSLILNRLPKTIVLVGAATLLAIFVSIPMGITQAVRRNSVFDYSATGVLFFLYAMPDFFIGEVLILYLSFDLHWFPSAPPTDASAWAVFTQPNAFFLPVLVLAVTSIAAYSRYMRGSMLETVAEDFIRTAQAKGAPPRRVLYRHALRNSLLPMITLIGLTLPAIIGGAIIVEDLFNYPGMGLLTVQSASNDDVPLVLGTTLVATIATVLGSLVADVLYAVADPRIRLGEG